MKMFVFPVCRFLHQVLLLFFNIPLIDVQVELRKRDYSLESTTDYLKYLFELYNYLEYVRATYPAIDLREVKEIAVC